jgi:hypothetical protein
MIYRRQQANRYRHRSAVLGFPEGHMNPHTKELGWTPNFTAIWAQCCMIEALKPYHVLAHSKKKSHCPSTGLIKSLNKSGILVCNDCPRRRKLLSWTWLYCTIDLSHRSHWRLNWTYLILVTGNCLGWIQWPFCVLREANFEFSSPSSPQLH